MRKLLYSQVVEGFGGDIGLNIESRHPNSSRETTRAKGGLPTLSSDAHLMTDYCTMIL